MIAFKLLDKDNSGTISKKELQACFSGGSQESDLMKSFDSVWSGILLEVDTNNDGEIDFEEFQTAMQSVLNSRASCFKKRGAPTKK